MKFIAGAVFVLLLAASALAADPLAFPVTTPEGAKAGELVLGQTTIRQAIKMYPRPPRDYKGVPQAPRNYPPVTVGDYLPKPKIVYAPYKSRYVLYFDGNEKLVMVQDTESDRKGKKRADIAKLYPGLTETNRSDKAYEMQGKAAPCLTVMFLFDKDDTVTQVAYAYTCKTTK